MRPLSPDFQAHLDQAVTTLAWCWRITRKDNTRFGFTDHDRPLTFDGTIFEAATGFSASEIKSSAGFAVDNLEVTSALSSDALDETDLALGHFDNAGIEIFRVNWQDTDQRVRLHVGTLGEIKRTGHAFFAEIRGLMHLLDQPTGRLYQHTCDAAFGDHRCSIEKTAPAHSFTSNIQIVDGHRLTIALPTTMYPDDHFHRGTLSITPPFAPTEDYDVRRCTRTQTAYIIELWHTPKVAPQIGATVIVTAGCDKHFATCRDRFANAENFRGFPTIPGTDFITAIAAPGAVPKVGTTS